MKKLAMSKTAQRKLALRSESVVTLTSRQLAAVAGGDVIVEQSVLSGCPTTQQTKEPQQ